MSNWILRFSTSDIIENIMQGCQDVRLTYILPIGFRAVFIFLNSFNDLSYSELAININSLIWKYI
jgi:hypothetical protein